MIRFSCSLALFLGLSSTAFADSLIAAYYAEFGREDFFNSRGASLADVGAVVQQERANYHRFGIRHPGDESDPFFSNRDLRSRIPGLVNAGPVDSYLRGVLGQGYQGWSWQALVLVCGNGNQPSRIIVAPANADGHPDC